jgi:hypothetical protein
MPSIWTDGNPCRSHHATERKDSCSITNIIADTFEKQRDNHISININQKFDKIKDENKKGITNEPGQQAIPLCNREKSSKCQQKNATKGRSVSRPLTFHLHIE